MLEFKFWVTFALLLNCNLFFSQNWTKFDKIIASDRTSDDFFGREVAISGNYAIIGVSSSNTDSDGINPLNKSGAAYIYEKDINGDWLELKKLNLLDDDREQIFENKTYHEFTISLTENDNNSVGIAKFLNVEENDDIIKRLRWLGLLDDKKITMSKGTNADLLVDLMLKKMSYQIHEKDMIIIHDEIVAKFEDRYEKRMSTMMVEGIPGGDSAMSRAVSLPAAIAAKYILENEITIKGVQIPTSPEIYNPVLDELELFGYKLKHKKIRMDY